MKAATSKATTPKPRKPQLLSADQRKAIEGELAIPYGRVELQVDGHTILLRVTQYKPLRYVIVVFIDGRLRGDYCKSDSALGAKFYRPVTRCVLTRKSLAAHRRDFGVRSARKIQAKYTTTVHSPFFNTARAFLRHVQTTCDSIDVVSIGYPTTSPTQQEGAPCTSET